MRQQSVLASDIDNTLTGDRAALDRLAVRLKELRKQNQLKLFLSTGRRLNQVLEGFENEGIPKGDAIISQVGTEIYLPPYSLQMKQMKEWDDFLHQKFSREKALSFIKDIEGLEMQPHIFNTPLKVSCYLDKAPDPHKAASIVEQRVKETDGDAYQVVWSSGRDLDILPAAAGKGKAIRFLIDFLELSPQKVIVAGDSGNDRSMFDEFSQGIVVNNAQPELKKMKEDSSADIYFAQKPFAAGVEEGLIHFDLL